MANTLTFSAPVVKIGSRNKGVSQAVKDLFTSVKAFVIETLKTAKTCDKIAHTTATPQTAVNIGEVARVQKMLCKEGLYVHVTVSGYSAYKVGKVYTKFGVAGMDLETAKKFKNQYGF